MAKVIPIRDFSKNEIMLTAFGDWLNDRTRVTFEEKPTQRRTPRSGSPSVRFYLINRCAGIRIDSRLIAAFCS